jgi:hypothetical protein
MQGHLVFALIDLGTGRNGAKLKAVWDVFAPSQGVTKLLESFLAVAKPLQARPVGTDRS